MSYFFRQQVHFEKRDWDESKVTRGETVPGTNKGSFKSPGDAAAGAGSAALTAHSGRRKFRAAATDSVLDNEVATSATPAQTMQAQFGPRMGEAEILTCNVLTGPSRPNSGSATRLRRPPPDRRKRRPEGTPRSSTPRRRGPRTARRSSGTPTSASKPCRGP
jgi:hypothetical protein